MRTLSSQRDYLRQLIQSGEAAKTEDRFMGRHVDVGKAGRQVATVPYAEILAGSAQPG